MEPKPRDLVMPALLALVLAVLVFLLVVAAL